MSGRLPTWLADWLNVSTSSGGDAATWELHTTWQWAPWITVLLVGVLLVYVALLYARESAAATANYRLLLASLRLCALAIVLVMLAQWAFALRLTGPPTIALVIDRSASMLVADANGDEELASTLNERLMESGLNEPTRLNLAKLLVTERQHGLVASLTDRYRLSAYFVAGSIERAPSGNDSDELAEKIRELSADGPGSHASRLGDAVRRVLDDFPAEPPAAVVLLSDGVTMEGVPLASATQEARRRGVPLFAIGLGSDKAPRDALVADVLVDRAAFVGDAISFQVQVKATGLEDQPAKVTLRRDGGDSPIATQEIRLPPAAVMITVNLLDRPTEPGDIRYVVEVEDRESETNTDNNRQTRTVAVRDAKIRVLLVFGYPSYEFRFLKTLLERDRTIELATFLQDADPEFALQDKTALRAFPTGGEELLNYDVVILGDVDPRLVPLSTWQHLRAFVAEKGGGAVFIAGPRSLPWLYRDNLDVAAILPIVLDAFPGVPPSELPPAIASGFIVRPTNVGLQSPGFQLGESAAENEMIWRELSPLYWLAETSELKPAAQVLAESFTVPRVVSSTQPAGAATSSTRPIICFQYVGAGRVLYHAIDSTWRWRLGAGDLYFGRYWLQTIRFLARGKLASGQGAELVADRREYRRGEPITLRARFLDPSFAPPSQELTVLLSAEGQPRERKTLRRRFTADAVFEAVVTDLKPGQYEALLVDVELPGEPPTARFSVTAPPGEMANTRMDSSALASAAETTRGRFYTIANADRLPADLPTGRRVPLENLPSVPIWNQWWLVALFLACITSEWILRKRKGML